MSTSSAPGSEPEPELESNNIDESAVESLTADHIKSFTREQLVFMVTSMDSSLSLYFGLLNGKLYHKLGVIRINDAHNPIIPVVGTSGMIVVKRCVFDDFTFAKPFARYSECVFKSWKGYKDDIYASSSFHSSTIKFPQLLWDYTGSEFFQQSYHSKIVLPSDGKKFIHSKLHPTLHDDLELLDIMRKAVDATDLSSEFCPIFEKIWINEVRRKYPDLFYEFMEGLNEADLNEILKILQMNQKDYDLSIRVHHKII